MNQKVNCWQHKGCGREPGGKQVDRLGVCPAAAEMTYNGVNGGQNAGRFCWYVAGTLCAGRVQGTFAAKFEDCLKCSFLREVLREEGESFVFMAMGSHFYSVGETIISAR